MDWGLGVLLIFFVLFVLGVPVVFAILIPSLLYIWSEGIPLATVSQRVLYALDSFPLVAVPVFIFVGNLMNASGITDRIYRFAHTLAGRLPGGLAQVNIVGSLIFSGVSGAALADVGGIGRIEIKAMKDAGFPVPFAAALTGASAIVGPIFPPSIPIIIYASVTSISAVQLLMAGILPALLCVAMLMIAVWIAAVRHSYPRSERWPTLGELVKSFIPAAPALATPFLLVGGMLSGSFTPTEASAVCVVYILLIGLAYREMSLAFIHKAAIETVRTSAAVLIIVAAAAMFGWILAVEQVPQTFAGWFGGISTDPLVLLLIVNLIFFVAGMFIDSTTATLLLVPIVAPPVVAAGVDPIHLGLVVIFNLMIGTVTPPFGLSLFLLSSMTGERMTTLVRAMLPFYPPLLLTLALLTLFPEISLAIPRLLR